MRADASRPAGSPSRRRRIPGAWESQLLGSKERNDIGTACLTQAHGGPGAFDDNDAFVPGTLCPVGIVEDMGLREVLGESPFTETHNLRGSEQAGAVTERATLNVVQS
jgi:hypothetical protein